MMSKNTKTKLGRSDSFREYQELQRVLKLIFNSLTSEQQKQAIAKGYTVRGYMDSLKEVYKMLQKEFKPTIRSFNHKEFMITEKERFKIWQDFLDSWLK